MQRCLVIGFKRENMRKNWTQFFGLMRENPCGGNEVTHGKMVMKGNEGLNKGGMKRRWT
jgi:hypothetical protein